MNTTNVAEETAKWRYWARQHRDRSGVHTKCKPSGKLTQKDVMTHLMEKLGRTISTNKRNVSGWVNITVTAALQKK